MPLHLEPTTALQGVKLLHTLVWAFFVSCIVAIPLMSWRGRLRRAGWLSALVWGECLVLACFGGRCPLTLVAARYTTERAANFDIFLPEWLAAYNKLIFGLLFVFGEIHLIWRWRQLRQPPGC